MFTDAIEHSVSFITYVIVFLIGLASAVLNFSRRELSKFSFMRKFLFFVLDVLSSGLLAVLSFYAVIGLGLNEMLAIAISGMFAHQGTRAIYLVELIIAEKLGANKTFDEIKATRRE
jgi:uncharacterized membrane protein YbjE (DUF340 family)